MFIGRVVCGEKCPNVELDHSFSTVTMKNVKPNCGWYPEPTNIDEEECARGRNCYKAIGVRFAL